MRRHGHVIHLNEVESIESSHGERFAAKRKRLAANAGAKEIGCSWYEIPPGKAAFPFHAHFGNEEAFFILSGEGLFRIGDERLEVSAGDYIACPAGASSAHSLFNSGEEPLRYLGISTVHSTDIMIYPDSAKIVLAGGADMHKGMKNAAFSRILPDQANVDYYQGEG